MKLKKSLNEMIKDERLAPSDYLKIRKLLKKPSDKKVIDGIIKQEKIHLRKLKRIVKRELK